MLSIQHYSSSRKRLSKSFTMNLNDAGRFPWCMIPERCHSQQQELRRSLNQNDLSLLQSVPPYHLQAIVKARRLPVSVHGQAINKQFDPASIPLIELAQYMF